MHCSVAVPWRESMRFFSCLSDLRYLRSRRLPKFRSTPIHCGSSASEVDSRTGLDLNRCVSTLKVADFNCCKSLFLRQYFDDDRMSADVSVHVAGQEESPFARLGNRISGQVEFAFVLVGSYQQTVQADVVDVDTM